METFEWEAFVDGLPLLLMLLRIDGEVGVDEGVGAFRSAKSVWMTLEGGRMSVIELEKG